jgi:hypothetical protein
MSNRRRSLFVAVIYISTVGFWYIRNNRVPLVSVLKDHNDNLSATRLTASGVPLHHHHRNYYYNRISVSLQKRTSADSDYYDTYMRFSPFIYLCRGMQPLPSTLQKYFNFIASIQTDLKIIFIGDSISEQFAEGFEAASLDMGQEGSARAVRDFAPSPNNPERKQLCMSISSPIRGGGVSAFWRMTNLILRENNQMPTKCQQTWRHWNEGQALAFLNHEYNSTELVMPTLEEYNTYTSATTEFWQKMKLASFKSGNVVNSFDAAILRLPYGWLQLDYMNNANRIIESIETTHRILGATTIIIPTLSMNNNVKSKDDWKVYADINHMIREVARNFTQSKGDIDYVLVQEFGNLTNQVLTENAKNLDLINPQRDIDYSQEGWEVELADVFLQRPSRTAQKWPPSYSQVCSSTPSKENETCPAVEISPDGMHWCIETFGARFTASIACLLGCVYNVEKPPTHEGLRNCEQRCNDQFMSLTVVSDEMFQK